MGSIEHLEFKIFYYLAFISFLLGIIEAATPLQNLLVIQPRSFAVFSALCLLFAISHQLRLLEKK